MLYLPNEKKLHNNSSCFHRYIRHAGECRLRRKNYAGSFRVSLSNPTQAVVKVSATLVNSDCPGQKIYRWLHKPRNATMIRANNRWFLEYKPHVLKCIITTEIILSVYRGHSRSAYDTCTLIFSNDLAQTFPAINMSCVNSTLKLANVINHNTSNNSFPQWSAELAYGN